MSNCFLLTVNVDLDAMTYNASLIFSFYTTFIVTIKDFKILLYVGMSTFASVF